VPSPPVVQKLTAFFFDNKVPLDTFKTVYRLCNDTCSRDTELKIDHFYWLWQSFRWVSHLARYYNMLHQTYMWINGTALNQLQTLRFQITVMEFGIASTHCEPQIRAKFKTIRGEEEDA
jgi:hypothetical protein